MKTDETTLEATVAQLAPAVDIEALRKIIDDAGTTLARVDIEGIADLGLPKELPILIDRKTGKAVSVKALIEEYRTHPVRKSGTANVQTLQSFIDLVDRHKTGNSVIFADTDWRKPSLTAVIDYHDLEDKARADNGKHRIHYAFPLSEEWKAWIAQDGVTMNQSEFAEWIENHLPDLSSPDTAEDEDFKERFGLKVAWPNQMVALSRGLQVNVSSRVKNNVVLQSGEGEITWDEEHKDAAGNKISVPGLFILSIPPFFMGETTRIPVRLRYRVSAGSVVWTFKLYRPDVYVTQQIERDLLTASTATELPAYCGKPEMAGGVTG
ncbi:DUF2303 family protein [Ciceribacter ferrooxidans]|uniref:DUF2303 family protein n=1 Tax=Ciceribacter ferrooxidans TaxID=2509717 RepID=A0A4Q2SVL7_9HYPH|nr:DUF2303 family protein [Ciceribacter ferrooxidans]RYC10136.1 DUF2303 family protein [Ciceribacter ferrooxidans]